MRCCNEKITWKALFIVISFIFALPLTVLLGISPIVYPTNADASNTVIMLLPIENAVLFGGKEYKDLVETVYPNILIEDDCRSIGGNWQMCITYVKPQIKNAIKSIVVKEFSGIDHLPYTIQELSLK